MTKLVLHSVNPYLFATGSWVHGQVSQLQRWSAAVVCKRTENLDQFPLANVHALCDLPLPRRWLEPCLKALNGGYFPFMKAVARRERALVLHSHFAGKGWQDLVLARATGLPLVCSFYGGDIWANAGSATWRERFRQLFAGGTLFLVEGNAMRAKVESLGCPPQKILVQHLGVDLSNVAFCERRAPTDGIVKVLICGRGVEKKGHELAVQIFARARRTLPNLRLSVMVIAKLPHEKELLARLHALVRELGLESCVDFPPPLPYAAWRKSLDQYHIFLAPSLQLPNGDAEGGAPVSLIDMSATGMPIVASSHCDIPEVAPHGVSGLIFAEADANAGAVALVQVAGETSRWPEWGRQGRAHVEKNYSLKTQVAALEAAYDRLVGA